MTPPSPHTSPHTSPHAVVLLSGGLDSATVLALARERGFTCHCLTFDYGQRHRHELAAAAQLAHALHAASHATLPIDLRPIGGSALTADIPVPKHNPVPNHNPAPKHASVPAHNDTDTIPITYVPARNLIFLAMATAVAEVRGAHHLFIGVNALDYSGYPDCRPDFIRSFEATANLATRAGATGSPLTIHAPLQHLTKAQIIAEGTRLRVPYHLTHSCYDPTPHGHACGSCDSCILRQRGFHLAGVPDPTAYA